MKTKNVNSIGFRNKETSNLGENLIGIGLGAASLGYLLIVISQDWFFCKNNPEGTEAVQKLHEACTTAAKKSK